MLDKRALLYRDQRVNFPGLGRHSRTRLHQNRRTENASRYLEHTRQSFILEKDSTEKTSVTDE